MLKTEPTLCEDPNGEVFCEEMIWTEEVEMIWRTVRILPTYMYNMYVHKQVASLRMDRSNNEVEHKNNRAVQDGDIDQNEKHYLGSYRRC